MSLLFVQNFRYMCKFACIYIFQENVRQVFFFPMISVVTHLNRFNDIRSNFEINTKIFCCFLNQCYFYIFYCTCNWPYFLKFFLLCHLYELFSHDLPSSILRQVCKKLDSSNQVLDFRTFGLHMFSDLKNNIRYCSNCNELNNIISPFNLEAVECEHLFCWQSSYF